MIKQWICKIWGHRSDAYHFPGRKIGDRHVQVVVLNCRRCGTIGEWPLEER